MRFQTVNDSVTALNLLFVESQLPFCLLFEGVKLISDSVKLTFQVGNFFKLHIELVAEIFPLDFIRFVLQLHFRVDKVLIVVFIIDELISGSHGKSLLDRFTREFVTTTDAVEGLFIGRLTIDVALFVGLLVIVCD